MLLATNGLQIIINEIFNGVLAHSILLGCT
jgi:hypothetical protein